MSDRVDVLVVGAGLAGLHTATRLAERGHEVVLAERRVRQGAAIRTTGIFVRKTLDDFGLPEDCLGPPIRRVRLYPPDLRRPVTLLSDRDEFRVGDMGRLYEQLACDAGRAGVALCPGTRYLGRQGDGFLLQDRHGTRMLRARFVVGADGARSRVAVDLGLDRNRQLLAGAEEVYDAPANVEPTFHCVIDPLVAPGYLAWVVNDGQHAHVGVAGYPDRFEHGLRAAMGRFAEQGPAIAGLARPAHVQR
ncbi:MAG: NAD(P)/FAD-dependent oxidoreductase, partial [Ornithinimicrobium sp.]